MHPHQVLARYDLTHVEGIRQGMQALADELVGYHAPRFYGTAFIDASAALTSEVFNHEGHDFPAMLLASITGHRSGTAVLPLSQEQLAEAIAVMSPAEQCRAFQHPNLAAWRRLLHRAREQPTVTPVAIFVAADYGPYANVHVEQFLGAGEQRDRLSHTGVA